MFLLLFPRPKVFCRPVRSLLTPIGYIRLLVDPKWTTELPSSMTGSRQISAHFVDFEFVFHFMFCLQVTLQLEGVLEDIWESILRKGFVPLIYIYLSIGFFLVKAIFPSLYKSGFIQHCNLTVNLLGYSIIINL